MASIQSKGHLTIDGYLFLIAKNARKESHVYGREESPHFVNKFSSGDPNYRDSTFFPHWVQNNWLNGFNQEKFNDGGKYYRSSAVDPTNQEKLTLQKLFSSAGLVAAGVKILCQEAWRASASSAFGAGTDGALTISTNTTDAPIDSACTGTLGSTTLSATNTSFAAGQFILIHQTRGTNAGTWQKTKIISYTAGTITTQDALTISYVAGAQVIVMKQYSSVTVNSSITWTAKAWDGTVGGILVFMCNGTVTITGTITATGKGFRGGIANIGLYANGFYGEGNNNASGQGANSGYSGGGGGNNGVTSTGGAGGGNGTAASNIHLGTYYINGGIVSGNVVLTSATFGGGGGGAGNDNNLGSAARGGNGGGFIFLFGKTITITGTITSNGENGVLDYSYYGGSGAGGSILIKTQTGTLGTALITATGGAEQGSGNQLGGAGGTGRIRLDYLTSFTGTTTPTLSSAVDSTLSDTPAGSTFTYYVGASNGKIYSWDGASTFTMVYDTTNASVNCSLISSVSGTKKMYFGTGNPAGTTNGTAKLYSFDGTTWALVKTFNTTMETCILSMAEFGSLSTKVYFGLGSQAKVYVTADFTTFTLSKIITYPSNPGFVFSLKEYNKRLYAGGGYPEQLFGNNYQFLGFLYSWDEYSWEKIGSFEHTVVKSMEVYDNLLFIGTIKKQFYVYNTASIDKLFEFPWNVEITSLAKFDDKLAIAIAPTPGSAVSGHEGIYLFDRNGFHNAFNVSGKSWYSIGVFNNNLMGGSDDGYVYQTNANTYQASGTLQTSYFEASLPGIDKKFRSLILQYESLPTGCSILAEYKTDEADASWTTIGTANVVASTQYEVNFSDTFYSKKISIRLTLATSVAASTPTLKVMDIRYVLMPDFKYLWKMKLACPDNIIWMDGTEPISTTTAASISAGATSLVLLDGTGFPTKGRAVLVDGATEDEFTWTGRTSNTLTGIPATGSLALSVHSSTGYTVKMTGKTLHNTILDMKKTKSLFAFVDIDEISYNVLFHQYQADNFVVNQDDGIENDVPITLLES